MRAIVVERWTDPKDLAVSEIPEPEAGPGQVRVEVAAAGCNFFDILMVRGEYQVKPAFPFTPGAELAGVVAGVGDGVAEFTVGDRVYGGLGFGAFAEQAVLPQAALRPIPDGMGFDEAAAFPIVYPTSYIALADRAALRSGETLLVHAAAGGVGIAAVQIGVALGARVIATAGGADKLEVARSAGAEVGIDYREGDFVEAVREATGGRGADVIYDSVGGDTFDRSLKCIAWNGRLLVIGFASGRIPEVRANRILLKNISLIGLNWGGLQLREPAHAKRAQAELERLHGEGRIDPVIYATFPLDQTPAALEAIGSRRSHGKVIVHPRR